MNRFRLDDLHPHIYRTHDFGKTWTEITTGLPDDGPINVVREDPVRKGLLFAGSEHQAWVSFNDGDDWQSLRLNMPATSIRDLVIHGRRSGGGDAWARILDSGRYHAAAPDERADCRAKASSVPTGRPSRAVESNTDTPLPPEEPAGQNPPDGAILDYYLQTVPPGRSLWRFSMRVRNWCADFRATTNRT